MGAALSGPLPVSHLRIPSFGHRWRWQRPGGRDYESFAELTDITRRRLCLPPERAGEVSRALTEAGVDPKRPADLGTSGREVSTIWWDV